MGGGTSKQLDLFDAVIKDSQSTKPDLEREGTFRFIDTDHGDRPGIYNGSNKESSVSDCLSDDEKTLNLICEALGVSESDCYILSATHEVPPSIYMNQSTVCLDAFFHQLDHVTRRYLGFALEREWAFLPADVDIGHLETIPERSQGLTVEQILRKCAGYALKSEKFDMAIAMVLILDEPNDHHGDQGLMAEIIDYIQSNQPQIPIPPQLVLMKARLLTNKGDLHGAIRELSALLDNGKDLGCTWNYKTNDQSNKVRGMCLQMTGQILNKMCCWKDAVRPLVESIKSFGSLAEQDNDGIIVSLELISKCLCKITHGDFMDLKDILGLPYTDRYYQAHIAGKEAAGLAKCPVFVARCQNQSAESLLMYAAQQYKDPVTFMPEIHQVLSELLASLSAHRTRRDIECRQEFFELVRTVYLLKLALDVSSRDEDQKYATRLEQMAMFLYAFYCSQLMQQGHLASSLNVTPKVMAVINCIMLEFGLGMIDSSVGGCDEVCFKKDDFGSHVNGSHTNANPAGVTVDSNLPKDCNVQCCSDVKNSEGLMKKRLEVGLPIDPQEYAIPDNKVPLEIFQDLCGCKIGNNELCPLGQNDKNEDVDGSDVYGITGNITNKDQDLPSLVSTFIPTFEESLTSESFESGIDSGMQSAVSDCSSFTGSLKHSTDDSGFIDISTVRLSEGVSAAEGAVKRARLLKFNPVTGIWTSQNTLVYLGPQLQLEEKKKGRCRDAFDVQFIHQDEVLGRYVGKRYRKQRCPSQYLQDIICQKTARFLVTMFSYSLHNYKADIQIQYVPVAHLQLFSSAGEMDDWINVEPYLEGDFIKLTNNLEYCNPQGKEIATALTHFSYVQSKGQLMLVDLQGWLPSNGKGVVYLTDPQFHSSGTCKLSSCDIGDKGMMAFWEKVHPECNDICHALNLPRPLETSVI